MKSNNNCREQGFVGLFVVLVASCLIVGGAYFYLTKQIPETAEQAGGQIPPETEGDISVPGPEDEAMIKKTNNEIIGAQCVAAANTFKKCEGLHVYFLLESTDLAAISDSNMKDWIIKLDRAYEAYLELVGTAPFDGEKIGIVSVSQHPGGWAVAGNPIKWYQPYIKSSLAGINETHDWSFGIMHELGHDFDLDNQWMWDGEFWANTKMYYVVETLNATVSQDINDSSGKRIAKSYAGSELKDYYKTEADNSYEKTLKNGAYNNDGLTYKFIYIKDRIGWEPFKQTFRYFTTLQKNQIPPTGLGKFNLFIDKLTEFSGIDVASMFNTIEMNAIANKINW